jgi:hypothetical protein
LQAKSVHQVCPESIAVLATFLIIYTFSGTNFMQHVFNNWAPTTPKTLRVSIEIMDLPVIVLEVSGLY